MPRTSLAISILLLLALPAYAQQALDPVDRLDEALAALQAGRYADAEAIFRQIIGADPQIEQAYLGLAESLLAQNRGQDATLTVVDLAQRMIQQGRENEAADLLGRALQIAPNLPVAHALLGVARLGVGDFTDAVDSLKRAMDLGERSTQTRLLLAAAQWEAGDHAGAEATYRDTIEATGGDPVPLHQYGSLLLWQGRYEEAIEPLDTAARSAPPTVDLLYDLGRALDGAGRLDAAAVVLRQAVEGAPQHAQARYAYARVLARLGRTEEARAEMAQWQQLYQAEQVMLHESKLAAARLEAGWTMLNEGRAAEAAERFRELPPSADALLGLGSALSAMDDHEGAIAAIERALRLEPDRRDLQRRLALERLAAEQQP
jgi:tetratricopeptide (TPR) repeat protein